MNTAFPLANSWVKVDGFGKGWGFMSVSVTATLEDTAAFVWDFESRAHADATGDTERSILETKGEFMKVVRRRQRIESKHGHIYKEREFVNMMSLHIVNANVIVVTMDPVQDNKVVVGSRSVSGSERSTGGDLIDYYDQAKERVVIRLSRRGERATKMEFVSELELGLFVNKKATKRCLEKRLDEATEIQRYFARIVELEDVTEKIGEVLAHDMAWNGGRLGGQRSKGNRAKHVEEVIAKSKALSAIKKKYPWIVILMQRAREGALSTNHSVSTKLSCIREEEARTIGNNLMPALKRNKTVAAGIDQWRGQNRAIEELMIEFPWMKGLFLVLGQSVVNSASWGLRWR